MDSPKSCSSTCSSTPISPKVFSPLPRKPNANKRSQIESSPFLELVEEVEARQQQSNRGMSYIINKLKKVSLDETEDHEFERANELRSQGELERKAIINHFYTAENRMGDIRPPSRANNPHIYDDEFIKMDQELECFEKDKRMYAKHREVLEWL